MRARWILDDSSPDTGRIGTTIIAKWWPGRYLLVSTVRLDSEISSIFKPDLPFLTQVVRCDEYGHAPSWDNALFKREYATLAEAEIGHREAVARFSQ